MTDEIKKPISERQAAARRENGKKSRGPVTVEGKQRSSQNSTKHGIWAVKLQALKRGPLREDPEEVNDLVSEVVADLNPGGHFLLRQTSVDVADKLWRLTRAQRWEIHGYSRPEHGGEPSEEADWILVLAGEDRKGAAVLRQLPDPSISAEDLWSPFCRLAFHFGASEGFLDRLDDADAPTKMRSLLALIERHFDSAEEAASLLDSLAAEREREAEGLYSAVVPDVVRGELGGAFSKNAERMVAHASRELDRSLARYWKLRDQLLDAAPPSEDNDDNPEEDGPPPTPVRIGPKGGDSSGPLSRLEAVLDDLIESTSPIGN